MINVGKYKACLCTFMSWKDNIAGYAVETEFDVEQLASITPDDIYRYFKYRAYGDADADENIAAPTKARSNSMTFWKKALSYFMPNNHMAWNDLALAGNPTRSTKVNKLIKLIKRKEAARLGKPSQARRALFPSEYESAIDVMDNNDDEEIRTFLSSYFKFQYNMIARLDDSAKFRLPDLKSFYQFPEFGVVARLCWS
jgi:hypothetical protein